MGNIYKQNKLCTLGPKECISQPRGCYFCRTIRDRNIKGQVKRSHQIPAVDPKRNIENN